MYDAPTRRRPRQDDDAVQVSGAPPGPRTAEGEVPANPTTASASTMGVRHGVMARMGRGQT